MQFFKFAILNLFLLALPAKAEIVSSRTVIINVAPSVVWDYLGNNSSAQEWSVFFDHISSLPSEFADGEVGALRRCYHMADETGITWDEKLLVSELHRYRKIRTYNVRNTGIFFERDVELGAEQIYEELAPNVTRLTFRGIIFEPSGVLFKIPLLLINQQVEKIFEKNLANIKAALEQGDNYERPYPWEPIQPFGSGF